MAGTPSSAPTGAAVAHHPTTHGVRRGAMQAGTGPTNHQLEQPPRTSAGASSLSQNNQSMPVAAGVRWGDAGSQRASQTGPSTERTHATTRLGMTTPMNPSAHPTTTTMVPHGQSAHRAETHSLMGTTTTPRNPQPTHAAALNHSHGTEAVRFPSTTAQALPRIDTPGDSVREVGGVLPVTQGRLRGEWGEDRIAPFHASGVNVRSQRGSRAFSV